MAKVKFTLEPSPTFKAVVNIPVAGGKPAPVEFIFKHRDREQFKDFVEGLTDRKDVDVVMDIASGWDLDDAFDAASIEKLVTRYMGAFNAICEVYFTELTKSGARSGN